MCPPPTMGLLLTAAGTGVAAVNRQHALRRQDRALAAGLRRQGALQRQANETVRSEIDRLAAATGEPERQRMLDAFLAALQAQERRDSPGAQLPAHERFGRRQAARQDVLERRALDSAHRLATVAGASRQREADARNRAALGSALTELARQSGAADRIAQLQVAERQPNPWIDAFAQALTGAGGAMGLAAPGSQRPPSLRRRYRQGTLIDPPAASPFSATARPRTRHS